MIRPFDLRDFALVRRLSERGVSLYTEPALTGGPHPLRGALLSMVGGDFPTYVWKLKGNDEAGFIQLYLEKEAHLGRILFLGSTCALDDAAAADTESSADINEKVWLPLLDHAVANAGRRGVHSVVAEVSETGDELPILRHAGFAIYTRQDIWAISWDERGEQTKLLRPRQPMDDWEIQLLYANTVPRLVQLVEPVTPLDSGECWVLREAGELTAFVHVHTGSIATWIRLFIHPNAEAQVDQIIHAALEVIPDKTPHPVYCCVRRYQSWLQGPMERAGFLLWNSQAVMVKHTVHHQQKPMPEMSVALDAQGIPVSAPMVPRFQAPGQKHQKCRQ